MSCIWITNGSLIARLTIAVIALVLCCSADLLVLLQHPHLPGASSSDITDKSDAKTPTYDPQPDMMTDENLANKPKQPGKHKDGDTVSNNNSMINKKGPRKEPEDIAPEQAGS